MANQTCETPPLILRPTETARLVGFTDRHLRQLEREGRFPKRFRLNPPDGQAVGHWAAEVVKWAEDRRSATQMA